MNALVLNHPRLTQVFLGVLAVALCVALVPLTGFQFLEDDSLLYGQMAGQLAHQPLASWLTPVWPAGRWKSGLFEEHLAVFLWPPALVGSLGLGWMESILLVNLGYLVGAMVLLRSLAQRRWGEDAAVVAAWVWLVTPGVTTYLVRGNHEPALAMGMVLALWGMERSEQGWDGTAAAAAGAVWCVAMKGVVGVLILPALLLWWWFLGRSVRQGLTVLMCGLSVVVFLALYDSAYFYRTGHGFLSAYLDIHLGYAQDKEKGQHAAKLVNLAWYLGNALWLAAPWTLVLVRSVWLAVKNRQPIAADTRALLACAVLFVVVLSMFDRRSIRYAFSTTPWMVLACIPFVAGARAAGWLDRVRPWAGHAWWLALVLVTAVRVYIHNHHYTYVSTQGF